MPAIGRHVLVKGEVQGVAFRWTARQKARELRVSGWIRNLPNGDVEVQVEGTPGQVRSFIQWLEKGPALAKVESIEESECKPTSRGGGFEIRATGA